MDTLRNSKSATSSVLLQAARWFADNIVDLDAYLTALNPSWGNAARARVLSVATVTGGLEVVLRLSSRFELPERARFVTVGVDIDGVRARRDLLMVKRAVADPNVLPLLFRADSGSPHETERFADALAAGLVVEVTPRSPRVPRRHGEAPGSKPTGLGGPATYWEQFGVDAPAAAGQTLLEAAEASGLNPVFGCRAGVCRRCSIPLIEGVVADVRDGRISDGGMHVQPCTVTAQVPCRVDSAE